MTAWVEICFGLKPHIASNIKEELFKVGSVNDSEV